MIVAENISKNYAPNLLALKKISFSTNKSSIIGVIGRNGAGKSTLFKIISGIISDFDGSCLVNGRPVSLDYSDKLSYLPETRGLDGRAQVLEHLSDMVRYKGIKKKIAVSHIMTWLDKFHLAEARYRRIDTLSKGNQQKLQFIIAVASNPDILILDEPFSGLDPITSDLFWKQIIDLKQKGCTIIFSTHNLSDKMKLCDQFLFIKQGELVENGSLESIQKKYDFILELKNKNFTPEMIQGIIPLSAIEINQGVYTIKIPSWGIAETIHSKLKDSFSEYFQVRNMGLDELFREINFEESE